MSMVQALAADELGAQRSVLWHLRQHVRLSRQPAPIPLASFLTIGNLNRLASLGSRVGLSGKSPLCQALAADDETKQVKTCAATVFFSTAVTVIDGAESPFNFVSTPTPI